MRGITKLIHIKVYIPFNFCAASDSLLTVQALVLLSDKPVRLLNG